MFKLTDEQKLLVDTTKKLMKRDIRPVVDGLKAKGQSMTKEICQELLKKTIPLGIMGNVVKEEYGGAGMDYLTYGLMYEQIDKAINSVIMISTGVTRAIASLGTDAQREKWLPGLLNADLIGCTAITEPNVGSNPAFIETRAVEDGDYYVINGNKLFITNGAIADVAIVVTSLDRSKGAKGLARFIVDKRESPFEARHIKTIGGEEFLGELIFEDCRVPKENIVSAEGSGLKDQLAGFQVARCFVGLTGLNLMNEAYEIACQYARDRKQFGKTIGSFQLIAEMITDMLADIETSKLLLYKALSVIDEGLHVNSYSSMAKYWATEAAVRVTSKAIQIHGAYGLCTEYPLEELFRLARMLSIPDGTTEIQKLIVAREQLGISALV
ncbi:acyl-CoA dehydrogenase family protein [Desulfosporosinus orientis]|nr:acyl-CoA dehydrogenase family protein [Desulfosporosinus orientis]